MSDGRFVARARHRYAADAHRLARRPGRAAGAPAARDGRGGAGGVGGAERGGGRVRGRARAAVGAARTGAPARCARGSRSTSPRSTRAWRAPRVGRGRRGRAPDGDRAVHRGGDAPRDRRRRRARGARSRTMWRSPTGWSWRRRTIASRRARTSSARSPFMPPSAPTTASSICTGSRSVAAEIRTLWKSFDLAGMTALVTDEMLDADGEWPAARRVPAAARRARAEAPIGCCSARRWWPLTRAVCASTTTRSSRRSAPGSRLATGSAVGRKALPPPLH